MALTKKRKTQLAVWCGAVAAILALGLHYLPQEADRPGFWEAFYSTLRLFVFERDLPTFPSAWPLIFIYFAAPLVTLSALGTAVSYLFQLSPGIRTRLMRDHVIVAGTGRTGRLLASALAERGVKVVGVDRAEHDEFADWLAEKGISTIRGDFTSAAALRKAGAARARALVFASGEDLANLEGGLAAYERFRTDEGPYRLIWIHLADDRLAETARQAVRTTGRLGIRFFDTYHVAAARMIETSCSREQRREIEELDIVGYGKFGSDLLEVLIRDLAPDEKIRIRVIDKQDRRNRVARLARHLGAADLVSFSQGDIRDLAADGNARRAYFLCTDDDLGNLSLALLLAEKLHNSMIIARMAHWPLVAMTEQLGAEKGITFVNINDLVRQGILEMGGLFNRATPADLKRMKK